MKNGLPLAPPGIEHNAFRADIEGLRGIAVISVLLFHAVPDWLPGGFVGVDVFFVISGYLVTQLLVRRLDADALSVRSFYAARIRRVFPALMLMFMAVTLAGCVLLPPAALREFGQSLGYSAVFLANLIFYRLSDYFAGAAELKPLLHTWSLAVEEQYYLLAPWAMYALHRRLRPQWVSILVGAAVVSGLGAAALAAVNPAAAFYAPWGRAAALLAGAALACNGALPGQASVPRSSFWPTLAMLVLMATLLAPAGWNLPPVLRGMVATMATCVLVLPVSKWSSPLSTVCLTHRGVRFFGRISYALYLWHWPLLVLAKYALLRDLQSAERFATLLLATILAWMTTRWIETPTRAWPSRFRFWGPFAALTAGLCVAIAAVLMATQGWPQRFNATSLAVFRASGDISLARATCHADANHPVAYAQRCNTATPPGRATVLIWADSHGVELATALGEALTPQGVAVAQVTASGCPPSLGYSPLAAPWCAKHNAQILAGIRSDHALQDIVLIARYGRYLQQDEIAYATGFSSALAELAVAGKRVILLTPIPAARFDVPVGLGMALARGIDFKPSTRDEAMAHEDPAMSLLRRLSQEHQTVAVRSLWDALCDGRDCPVQRAGVPLYFDDNHLSMQGARGVAAALSRLEPRLGRPPGGGAYNQAP